MVFLLLLVLRQCTVAMHPIYRLMARVATH
jgi:hypothetical protein